MTNWTIGKAIWEKIRAKWPLKLAGIALVVWISTLYLHRWPWLTALSALILVSLGIASVTGLSSQRLWKVLVVLALGLYFGSLSYQAEEPAREARYLAWATPQLSDNSGSLILAIAYPRIIPLEAPDKPGRPLSVYLWPPVLPVTSTLTATAIPGKAAAAPVLTGTVSASTPTPITTTQTLTPTQATSYTVAFLPYDDGLLFTDEEGVPVAPRVVVRPGRSPDKPAVLYVRRAPMDIVPASVPITVQVYGPDGKPRKLPFSLKVRLEDTYNAWWRHFWNLVLGPTTPLLALAAALIGFGWQWWQEGQKRKQAQLDEIRQVKILVGQEELAKAGQKLVEVTSRYGREPGLRGELEEARKCVHLAQMEFICEVLAATNLDEAYRRCEDLKKLREDEGWTDPELITSLEETEAAITRQPLRWPELWPDEMQRRDSPAIAAWLEESGTDLEFNPFGPERAEEDPLLPQLFVEPPDWERMKAPEPTVVFGANGSGRTASCLLLAHTCTTTRLGLDRTGGQIDTFPVRLALFPEGKLDQAAETCWRMLTRALAQDTLKFLARNPQTFAKTPFGQQRALARLFAMHRHYLGDLVRYLGDAAPDLDRAVASYLADNIRQAAQGTQPPTPADEAEVVTTLAEARLLPFQQCYVLVEVPDRVSTQLPPEEIAHHLGSLLQMMRPLAARKVYLKLFIPVDVKPYLGPLPSQVNEVELSWELPVLQEMLKWRVQQAGAASFRALFRRLPREIDPEALLVQAALKSKGPPRRLIQLGQELLAEHIRRTPGDPRLHWEALKAVLEKSAQGGAS